ncbi:UTP11-like, U3 small nucleolar ribonucleoprotein, partial [Cichlidogyrus casuarinus]
MPFASFKNIQKRNARVHKERAQPQNRKKFGILPKKTDFIKRSRDYQAKESKLRELRIKSMMKNPDEFYFSMNNANFDKELGHIPLNCVVEKTDQEMQPILKMDIEKLKIEIQSEKAKIAQLRERFNLGFANASTHTVFVENDAEYEKAVKRQNNFQPISKKLKKADSQRIALEKEAGYTELGSREKRLEQLDLALKRRMAKQQEIIFKNEIVSSTE